MKQTRDSIQDVWGERTPFQYAGEWPARVDEHVDAVPDRWVQSCCVLCTNGCGLDIGVKGNEIVGVRGRADDSVSRGRLGPKGLNGWRANKSSDRLTTPLLRTGTKGKGEFREATWDEAMTVVVQRCQEI